MKQTKKTVVLFLILITSYASKAQLTEQELLAAIKLDDYTKIESYFKNGQNDPNMLIGRNKVPLIHYVCSINKYRTAQILIDAGVNVDVLYYDDSPIMTAIYYDNYKIMELLLKSGVNANFKNPHGKTAAISAVKYNKPKALEILKQYQADFSIEDLSKKTAIDYAWELQHVECYKLLSKITDNKYSSIASPSYFDGPYIFWENKNKLRASYLISDSITKRTYKTDTLINYKKEQLIIKHPKQLFDIPIRKIKKNSSVPSEYRNAKKIMAIGDLHGEFTVFKDFLINNQIIDKDYNWIFGAGHLVLAGDIFDRGPNVNECFWLLYKLENEAQKQGGNVHFVIGNHEIMQLSGDKRYLSKKYLFLFNELGLDYTDAYNENTELGRWLRSKNAILRINDILFVHGGLSHELIERKINTNTINKVVQDIMNRTDKDAKNETEEFIMGNMGPLWYRGYIKLDNNYYKSTGTKYDITQKKVDQITAYFTAKTIVFANTHVNEIKPMFNNKLYGIDIPFEEKNVELQGLYIENENFYRAFMNGTKEKMN